MNRSDESGIGQTGTADSGEKISGEAESEAGATVGGGQESSEGSIAETAGTAPEEGDRGPSADYEDFTLPDGVQVDDAALGEALPVFRELGLDQEGAQRVVDLFAKVSQQQQAALREATARQVAEQDAAWDKAAREQFGDRYDAASENYKAALRRFGDESLGQFFDQSGLSKFPAFMSFMDKVGGLIGEAPLDLGEGGKTAREPDPHEILYPKSS